MKQKIMTAALLAGLVSTVWASDVQVQHAWTRAMVVGQQSTGVFMEIYSPRDAMLIKGESPVGKVELHEMKMQGDVMKMRPVKSILVNAKTLVALKPGDLHVMVIDMKKPLKAGEKLPLELTFEFADKRREIVPVNAEVIERAATK